MRKVAIALFIISLTASFALADVNVTYRVNSSTVQGFTDSTTVMQIRGGEQDITTTDSTTYNIILQWNAESVEATNLGGDYWQAEVTYPDSMIGWRINWKVGATLLNSDGTTTDFWEDFLGNRGFILPDADTTLTMAYVSNGYDPPYTPTDSIDVFFRVNMGALADFNPNTQSVYIVGAFPSPTGEDNMWVPDGYPLTREADNSDYWSYHMKLDPNTGPYDSVMYRFTQGSWDQSEQIFGHGMFPDNENRGTSVHQDTTLAWKYWNDTPPAGFTGEDTVNVTFLANLSNASENNGFSIGDTLLVRYGYFGSSTTVGTDTLTRQGFTFNYSVTVDSIPVSLGEPFYYQYYLYKKGQEQREIYFNFDYSGDTPNEAERRAVTFDTAGDVSVNDTEDSETDARRMPLFRNNELLTRHVTVTLTCDIRPAVFQVLAGSTLEDIQGDHNVTPAMMATNPDTIFSMGVFVNGPMSNNGEGTWQSWGGQLASDTTRTMYDDGTHGDAVAGDSIFSITYEFDPDSGHTVGQEFKYGIGGGDNESNYGLNHIENIDDSSPTTVLETQFGSINPNFYSAWDYDAHQPTGIEDEIPGVAKKFELGENYPNPFNPSTTFSYTIPKQAQVRITVFNILGQQIYTNLVNNQEPGTYNFTWNGVDNAGMHVSSGVYFYQVNAGQFSATHKMILMK